MQELRELASGIHPALLSERGLGPALEALAGRAPIPVTVTGIPAQRLPAPIESAAYFTTAEALTNVAKYAQADFASVDLTASRATCGSRSPTTASAAPTCAPARGCAACATASRRSTGGSRSTRRPGPGTTVVAEIPL